MKYRTSQNLLPILVIFMVLFFSVTGYAGGKITIGAMISVDSEEADTRANKIIIKPMISAESRWDSNFYKADTDERGVYTQVIRPGIALGYKTAKSSILFDYTFNAYFYKNQHDVPPDLQGADADDYVGHTARLSALTRPFDRLTLGLEDVYYMTRDPARESNFSNSTSRAKYSVNRFSPSLLYEFGDKFSAGLKYRNTLTDYDHSNIEGSVEHRGIFDLIYNFTPTTHLDLEYAHWKRDYDRNTADYNSDEVRLTLRKNFSRFALEVGGGYHKRNFDDTSLKNIDMFSYRFAFSGKPGEKSSIMFAAEQDFNDSGTENAYFKGTRFTLGAGYTFWKKLLARIEGKYQISDYESGDYKGREDDTYGISGRLGYIFSRWLTFGISGGFETRDSNWEKYDYDNKYIMGNIDLCYDPAGN
ncbi:outer membrane beta-barrel protein [Desulfonema magnum]|uniref:Beta-barrel porin type 2 domain-containing protein n=1 Tax=Desulfonema magnum TaxID=45655 RepID=A0A975BI65_9BACT|nr:outer membrane beta-barrel protein [Desulfonema magnum]QTA85510.1 Putative beta-barrel porin type 2 domain-containing protein [Desulfonema magnum]